MAQIKHVPDQKKNKTHESINRTIFRPLSCLVALPVVLIVSRVVARPLLLLKQAYPTFYVNKNL